MARSLILTSLLFLAACSTHVNIPPLPGDPAGRNPNATRVAEVESVALAYVVKRWPPEGGVYAVVLPTGTDAETMQKVSAGLPAGVSTEAAYGGPLPTYEVAQVSINGMNARVDIVAPTPGGARLVSVFETVDIDGWYARRSREWVVPVQEALEIIRSQPGEKEVEKHAE